MSTRVKSIQNAFGEHRQKALPRSMRIVEDQYAVKQYEKLLGEIHPEFCKKLINRAPTISAMEMRICMLTRLFISVKETANVLNISMSSVETHRSHAREKLGIEDRKVSLISVLHAV